MENRDREKHRPENRQSRTMRQTRRRRKEDVRLYARLLAVCLALVTFCAGLPVQAADPAQTWDSSRTVTIEIQLSENNRDRSEVIFWIYEIAQALPAAPTSGSISVELTEHFAETDVPLTASNTSELLQQIRILRRWIHSQNIVPDYTVETNADGYCALSGLDQGVYLIIPDNTDPYYGVIATSMIVLPRTDENGSWVYTEHMVPKYTDQDDEYFEEGDENDTMAAPNEETSEEASEEEESTQEESGEESVPEESSGNPIESIEESGEQTTAAAPDTTAEVPGSTAPPTQATTSVIRSSESAPQILGIDDPGSWIGMMLIASAGGLLLLSFGLMICRRNRK